MSHIYAISNQKGGVGKTTTAVNIATALAAVHQRVLLIDLDPQGNATTGVGFLDKAALRSMFDVFMGYAHFKDVITPTFVPNLSLLPATIDLIGAEVELVTKEKRHILLKQALNTVSDAFDYILIDCPPSMGLLTLNAMVAADGVIIPLQCEYYALEGLSYLLQSIQKIQKTHNQQLGLFGIVLTMFDKRSSLCVQVANDVRTHLKNQVFDTVIPRNIRVSEAPSFGKPVLVYDVNCLGSQAYMSLVKEILHKNQTTGLSA